MDHFGYKLYSGMMLTFIWMRTMYQNQLFEGQLLIQQEEWKRLHKTLESFRTGKEVAKRFE